MKELSIEEKAKAYDEALKVLHKYDGANIMFSQSLKEEMFPTLKESEDERIRENIIATIHLYYGEPLEDEAKEMIAWLERQGKNNMGISEATKQKLEDNLNKALEKETPESFNKFLDEQGEQMPADTEKGANGNEREIPNFAWSEEDEKIIIQIVDAVGDYFPTPVADKIKNWLKSLKDRVQPKQEWSVKDEAMLLTIINRLQLSKNGNASEIPYVKRCVDWLESLRPQIHWKPSDEQMAVLNEVINYAANSEFQHWNNFIYTLLKSLREQLKKLRDE